MSAKPRTLYDKIWDDHLVDEQADGTSLLYIDRHIVHEAENIDMTIERGRVAGDRKMWDRVKILGDGEIPVVVGHRVGDAEEIAYGVLVKPADLHAPLIIKLMFNTNRHNE